MPRRIPAKTDPQTAFPGKPPIRLTMNNLLGNDG